MTETKHRDGRAGGPAAWNAYGVLEELRDTTVMAHGRGRRLLDEINVITSVSGGSFTVAYYGVLVGMANAQTYDDFVWSKQSHEPGVVENITASFDSAIGIMNSETVGLAERGFRQWADRVSRRPSRRGKLPVDLQYVVLTYDKIRDPAERRAFNEIPTTLFLKTDQVDRVRVRSGCSVNRRKFHRFAACQQ